jgi:hypothetical protein
MTHKDVELQQAEILGRINSSKKLEGVTEVAGVLKSIRSYTEEEAKYAMGDFGVRLRSFSRQIDLGHPDLRHIYEGSLTEEVEGTFGRDAADLLKLAAYGKAWGLSQNVLENLKRVISKHDKYAVLNRAISDPSDNQLHVRFVEDKGRRTEIRQTKKMQPVGLGSLYKKGSPIWEAAPDDFQQFHRHAIKYQKDIDEASQRKAHFESHGLTSMAAEIEKSIGEMKAKSWSGMYYGFNKISLVIAAITLGKMCGYKFKEDRQYGHFDAPHVMAYAQPTMFKEYKFFGDKFDSQAAVWFDKIEYMPRIYTYEELKFRGSVKMSELIDLLEEYPELGGKPLFDHYRVLVPGLNYPNHFQTPPFRFKKPDGTMAEYDTIQQSQIDLDMTLLESKAVVGVLLGERDGDHYFVSYWDAR